ncbi:hypothetical protein BDN71DRAFT_1592414 [Pleurotus eryngii]|uniref:Uncharacterized protein n=1 Tax=Pleurotus eryngii TaxID=5323 RepID=A0A9P5ZNS7_PLEER|nr:hypothetical protein BDN71DRAFT_1592414 [Pleurotus eryngii]
MADDPPPFAVKKVDRALADLVVDILLVPVSADKTFATPPPSLAVMLRRQFSLRDNPQYVETLTSNSSALRLIMLDPVPNTGPCMPPSPPPHVLALCLSLSPATRTLAHSLHRLIVWSSSAQWSTSAPTATPNTPHSKSYNLYSTQNTSLTSRGRLYAALDGVIRRVLLARPTLAERLRIGFVDGATGPRGELARRRHRHRKSGSGSETY